MKLVVFKAYCLRSLANGIRAIANKLFWAGYAIHDKMERSADAAYSRAEQLRLHAAFLDTTFREEKVDAAVLDVNKEVDHLVAGAHYNADTQGFLGDKLNDILAGCK